MRLIDLISRRWLDYEPPSLCHDFGIGEALTAFLASDLGVGAGTAATAGPILAGVGEGAAGGAALAGVTGGNPLTGALTGGITGGAIPIGGDIAAAAGIPTAVGDVAGGAAGGLIGAGSTGGNLGLGAATGGAGGLLSSIVGGGSGAGVSPSVAAPSAIPGGGAAPASGAPTALASGASDLPPSIAAYGPFTNLSATAGQPTNLITPSADALAVSGGSVGGGPGATPLVGTPANVGEATAGGGDFGGGGSLVSQATDFLTKPSNLLPLAGIGIMGADLLFGNQPLPAEGQLQSLAGSNAASAASLESYVQTGKLPPGLQEGVDLTTKANEAQIRSTFARMGLAGSTQETQALAGVREQATAQIAKIAEGLLAQGVQLSGISGNELAALLTAQTQNEAAFQAALGRFAGGLAGARLTSGAGT